MKMFLFAALVVVVLLAIFTKKSFTVERVLAASKEQVWAVLVDTTAYPEWNPVFTEVDGKYVEGAKLVNKVRDPNDKIIEMTATVRSLDEPHELNQVEEYRA